MAGRAGWFWPSIVAHAFENVMNTLQYWDYTVDRCQVLYTRFVVISLQECFRIVKTQCLARENRIPGLLRIRNRRAGGQLASEQLGEQLGLSARD
jgi:hypothetical protein